MGSAVPQSRGQVGVEHGPGGRAKYSGVHQEFDSLLRAQEGAGPGMQSYCQAPAFKSCIHHLTPMCPRLPPLESLILHWHAIVCVCTCSRRESDKGSDPAAPNARLPTWGSVTAAGWGGARWSPGRRR